MAKLGEMVDEHQRKHQPFLARYASHKDKRHALLQYSHYAIEIMYHINFYT